MSIAQHIDHTNLKPTATVEDVVKLCDEAQIHGFRAVCVNPCRVDFARKQLEGSDIKIAAVVGFPLGANSTEIKVAETTEVIENGAREIDMVWNLGDFKKGKYLKVVEEITRIVEIAHLANVLVKVIVETCYLDENERVKAYQIVDNSDADCIKTSTGFAPRNATALDIITWRGLGNLKIKASGGIRTYVSAKEFIRLGANYLGTSHGVTIVQEEKDEANLLDEFKSSCNSYGCSPDCSPKEEG